MFYSKSTNGFYSPDIHGDSIPDDAVEITAEEHRALLAGQSEGKRIVPDGNGRPMLVDPDPIPAAERRAAAKRAVDTAAGNARSRFITVIPGQEGTYQLKADEAAAYIAAGRPADTSAYPMLAAEAAARGLSVSDLADEVAAMRAIWVQVAAQIEAKRLSGKAAVDAAADEDDFAAVAAPFINDLDAMQP